MVMCTSRRGCKRRKRSRNICRRIMMLFEMLAMKEEDLMDTNNGYVYLTERLQEKEEEQEHLQEDYDAVRDARDERGGLDGHQQWLCVPHGEVAREGRGAGTSAG